MQKLRAPFYKSDHTHTNECGDFSGCEITSSKKTILDNKPHHIGVAILQWSKYLLTSFMYFLYHHLEDGKYKTVYADTGMN